MSSALHLVPIRRDDDSPAAAWVPVDGGAVCYLTRERARALTDTTRTLLGEAGANLVELRAGSAHLALGYDTWHDYVRAEFGELSVYKLVRDRQAMLAERDALIASLTIAGHVVREQRDELGASVGTIHATQRRLGLVPDKPLPAVVDEPEPVDPYRGLSPKWSALARVAAQEDRGLTSTELRMELDAAPDTAHAALSKLAARGLVVVGTLDEARLNRRPYRITDAGRVKLAQVLAVRDAAERGEVA